MDVHGRAGFAAYGRSLARKRLYLSALSAIVTWLAFWQVELRIRPASEFVRLHGEAFSNRWVAGGGALACLLVALAVVGVDLLLLGTAGLVRTLRSGRPLARRLVVPALCALTLGAIAWWAGTRLGPLNDCLFWPLAGEATEYAAGYSSEAFAAVAPGMSWDEVRTRLGSPLDEGSFDGGYIVRYSRGVESSSYWRRVVFYDRKGGRVLWMSTGLFVS